MLQKFTDCCAQSSYSLQAVCFTVLQCILAVIKLALQWNNHLPKHGERIQLIFNMYYIINPLRQFSVCDVYPMSCSHKDILCPSVNHSQISKRALGVLSFLTWAYFCLPCAMTDIANGGLSFPNLIVLSSSTFCGSPYGPDSLPPTLAPQPMRLLRRSSISISQGLKKFQGLQNLTAPLRHQDTLFFRLFWGKSSKIWYLQKKFFPSAYSRWCFFFSFKIIPLFPVSRVIVNCCKWWTLAMLNGSC